MILPVDRSQSTSGYIELKIATNGWTTIRKLTGIEPDTIIPDGTMITLPTWGSIVGRHTRGGNHSAIQLFYFNYTTANTFLQSGDIILFTRISNTNQILFGNGQTRDVNRSIFNSTPLWEAVPFDISFIGSHQIHWFNQTTSLPITGARIQIENVSDVNSSGLDIATGGNNGLNGPIYVSKYNNTTYSTHSR